MSGTSEPSNELIDYDEFCGIRGEEMEPMTTGIPTIEPTELKARLDRGDDLFILGTCASRTSTRSAI